MRCWYCKEAEMVDTDDGFHHFKKCPECEATWCDVPKLVFKGLIIEKVSKGADVTKYRPYRKRGKKSKV